MWTEAIFLLTKVRFRAILALILTVLTLTLCACAAGERPAAPTPTPAPENTAPAVLHGRWTGSLDVGRELTAALGIDLSPWLDAPLLAELRFALDEEGRCTLAVDYSACEAALRPALAACVRELQEQESGEALSGLALAEALGADPNDLAAALCDELLPPTDTRSGRFFADRAEITWRDGGVSSLREEDGALWLTLPDRGEIHFVPLGD